MRIYNGENNDAGCQQISGGETKTIGLNVPGFQHLGWLLPQHVDLVSELYFLFIALMMGQPIKLLPADSKVRFSPIIYYRIYSSVRLLKLKNDIRSSFKTSNQIFAQVMFLPYKNVKMCDTLFAIILQIVSKHPLL